MDFIISIVGRVAARKLLGKKGANALQLEKAGDEAEYIIRDIYNGAMVYLDIKYNKINYLLK